MILRFTNTLKHGPKVYFRCENEPNCLKRCFVKFPDLSNSKYEIHQCEIHHFHKNAKRLSKRCLNRVDSLLKYDINKPMDHVKISMINSEIANENFQLCAKQLYNLKYRMKKKNTIKNSSN